MRAVFLAAALGLGENGCGGGGSDPRAAPDASVDVSMDAWVRDGRAPGAPCVTRADCDDGLFCTGVEECLSGVCVSAGNAACRASCADVACTESGGGCVLTPRACSEDVPCKSDRDCADGSLCDGVEQCIDGRCQHGARTTCVAGACQHAECSNSGVGDPWCRIVGLARCP